MRYSKTTKFPHFSPQSSTMKSDDVRIVQFWPPFVPRAHPPYARFTSAFYNSEGQKPVVSIKCCESEELFYYHCISGQEHTNPFPEDELANFVDTILEDQDHNDDGYIDYPEFVSSLRHPPGHTVGS